MKEREKDKGRTNEREGEMNERKGGRNEREMEK